MAIRRFLENAGVVVEPRDGEAVVGGEPRDNWSMDIKGAR